MHHLLERHQRQPFLDSLVTLDESLALYKNASSTKVCLARGHEEGIPQDPKSIHCE